MDRRRNAKLKLWAPSTHSADDRRSNGLNGCLTGKSFEPWDQTIHIGAVGNDNPAQS